MRPVPRRGVGAQGGASFHLGNHFYKAGIFHRDHDHDEKSDPDHSNLDLIFSIKP